MTTETMGDRIRKFRKRLGMTGKELAERFGVSPQYISFIEKYPERRPSLDLLVKISQELGTTTDQLLTGANQTEETIRNGMLRGIKKDLERIQETLKQLRS